jgi:group I intron endonuclease
MPRLPIDYSKTIIYKIVCNDLNICDVYVGSTTDFTRRKGEHKSICNNEKSKKYNRKVYQTIRANGGWDNFSMVEIEKYPCNDSNEAHARERYYLELLNAKLNIQIPTRTNQEYYKKYSEDNKEKIKQYREDNKEKIKQYREDNKEKRKQYIEANKEKIAEYKKKYREANKEKIAERKKKYNEANKEKITKQRKQYRESKKQN